MQERYLTFYKKQLAHPAPVMGLWLIHGDEELLHTWLIELIKPTLSAQGQRIKRMELSSVKAWQEVLVELQSQSLFDDAVALIITGKHKPDESYQQALIALTQSTDTDTTSSNTLIWLLPKQDKKAQTTKLFKRFAEHGTVIDAELYDERMRRDVLLIKAEALGVHLDQEAWQMLFDHTEGNLVSAYQTLQRLSLLFDPSFTQPLIDTKALSQALVSDSQYNVFNLSDALLQGDVNTGLKILHELKKSDTAPSVVLWAFAKDIHTLSALQAGKSPESLGVWRSKVALYHNALRRISLTSDKQSNLHRLSALLFETDKAIKGLQSGFGKDAAWRHFADMALLLTHTPLAVDNLE